MVSDRLATACTDQVRAMTSEFDNLMVDPSVKRRADTGTDVDPAADELR
jgi:hypothetical protein